VVQALILAGGRLAEHTAMPPALFCSHVIEAARRLIAERDDAAAERRSRWWRFWRHQPKGR
jgi:hypothetical protein